MIDKLLQCGIIEQGGDSMKTIKETAKIFGVHWQTIRNWIRDGIIKAVKIERTVRIPDEEIERLKRGK